METLACAAERIAEEAGDDALRAAAANAIGWSLIRTPRHEEAEAAIQRAWELAESCGDASTAVAARSNLGILHLVLGRLEDAERTLEGCLAAYGETG